MFSRAVVTALLMALLRWAHTSEVCTEMRDGGEEYDDEASLLAVKTTDPSFSGKSACEQLFKTCTNLYHDTPTCSEGATAPDGHSATKCVQSDATCYGYQQRGSISNDVFSNHGDWSISVSTTDEFIVVTFLQGCTPPTTTTLTSTTLTSTTLTSTTLTSTTVSE